MNFGPLSARVQKFLLDNAPAILTGIAVTGTAVTAYLTGKATVKAVRLIDEHERENNQLVDPIERAKEIVPKVWKFYIPAGIAGVMTVTAVIGAHRIGTRRQAALAAGYVALNKLHEEYREKIAEKVGDKKEKAYRDEIEQEREERDPMDPEKILIAAGRNYDSLFKDAWTGRYFRSDMEIIKAGQNRVNYNVNNNFYASLNDFYDAIGLDRIDSGEEYGWNADKLLELEFHPIIQHGEACIVLRFAAEPIRGYYRCS